MQVLSFVIPRSQLEAIVQIFEHVGVEPHVTFKVRKAELFLTMPHPRADLLWQMPHLGKGEVKNARGKDGRPWN